MAFAYITPDTLNDTWKSAKKFMDPLFTPLDEFERIARNRPHPSIAKGLPRVTDGTLSGLIQETPKRIIQQIPTGKVESEDDWLDLVAGYILEHEILPNANLTAALIQKCWALTSKCLTYGAQPVFVQFINRGDYFGTDFTLPYIKDVFLEPGKLSDRDSNVIFLRSWYQPGDIKNIIAKEEMLAKMAKKRGDKYETPWNTANLQKLLEEKHQKPQEAMSANERDKTINVQAIQIIHAFQRGVGATFYSFSPDLEEEDNILREKVNKDPRGQIPIHYMYSNVDLSNPLGRGSVELSGGMQNLLDSEVQSYQYMRALLMNPPLEIRGNVPASVIKYAPAAHWRVGSDPNASIKPAQLTTDSLTSFPNNYGLIKGQILNLNNSLDTSISADVGNPGYSKTPAGIDAQQAKLGVSDNYIRKQFEDVFAEICETMVNLYFAERSGTQELCLDDDTAAKVKKIRPDAVNEKNYIMVNYDDETQQLKFEVDASTSTMKDDAAERDRLIELLDLSGKYPIIGDIMGQDGQKELVNRIIVKSGVEDPEKIMPSGKENQQGVGPDGQPVAGDGQQGSPTPMDPKAVEQIVGQMLQQYDQQKPKDDPLARVFKDLPEDTKKWWIEQQGAPPSTMVSPTQANTDVAKVVAAGKVAQAEAVIDQEDAKIELEAEHKAATVAQGQQTIDNTQQNAQAQQAQAAQDAATQGAQDGQNGTPDTQDAPQPGDVQADPNAQAPQSGSVQINHPDDKVLIEGLIQRGYTQEQAVTMATMMGQGASNEEILKAIHGAQPTPQGPQA